jgi:hypothetical protein
MPMRHEIDESRSIVLEYWDGAITAEDLAQYWRVLTADDEAMLIRRSVADVKEIEIRFSGEEMRNCILTILEPALKDRKWKVAIVISSPLQYGVARQFVALAQQVTEASIFDEPSPALDWLLQQ